MAALVGQAVNTPAAGTSHTVSRTVSAGNLLVICIAVRTDVAVNSVAGSVNASWPQAGTTQDDNTTNTRQYYVENCSGGSETVTVTTASSATVYLNLSEWSGIRTSTALDQTNGASNASGTSHSHGSITTTGPGLIITASAQNGAATETVATGFTALTNTGARDYFQYKISSGAETTTATYTTDVSVASTARIANFLDASAGSAIAPISHYHRMLRASHG
jgi:hypothetical protein